MADPKLRQYDLLVTSIHAVVLEPTKWDALLRRIGEAIAACSGIFYLRDKVNGQLVQAHGFGRNGEPPARHAEHFAKTDSWPGLIRQMPIGTWVCDHEHLGDTCLSQPFFEHFMQPQGLRHIVGARAFDDGHNEVLISFQRKLDQEPFGRDEAELLARLSPHIELACRLSTEFSRLRMQAAVARQALDRLVAPLWVVDAEGMVLFTNQAASQLGLPGIAIRQGRLLAELPAVQTRLQTLLQQAGSRKAKSGALALERLDGGRLAVLVAPLPADSPLVADLQRPLVLLMAHDPNTSDAQPLDILAALYGLSPAECRLAARLLEGETASEAAKQLQVQVSTVRTQIKSMFWKTGTHRQGELLKLLGATLLLKI